MNYPDIHAAARRILEEDKQSIHSQLMMMTENHLRFLVLNESRNFSGSCASNPDLADFCNQGYIFVQTMLIRSLAFDAQPGSLSLRNVLHILRKHRKSITRSAFVTVTGAPYDYEPDLQKEKQELEEFFEKHPGRITGRPANTPWKISMGRHENFDRIANLPKGGFRRPGDSISEAFLKACEQELDVCNSIGKMYANFFVAHLQHEPAVAKLSAKDRILTIGSVAECHKALRRLYNTLCVYLFDFSSHPTFSRSYDIAKGLDKSWLGDKSAKHYRDLHHKFEEQINESCSKLMIGY